MIERLKAERERMKAKGGSTGSDGFLKLPKDDDAEVRIRILPAKNWYDKGPDDADLCYKRFGVHWINSQKVICPHQTFNEPCPICETVWELNKSTNEEDIATAKEFRVKKRHWINCVEVDNNNNIASEPKIYEFGVKLLENILAWSTDEEYEDLSDPKGGYTYRIIKTKKDGFPNYDGSKPVKNPAEIDEKTMKSLLEKSADIHSIIDKQVKTYDEIQSVFDLGGTTGENAESESEDVDQDELLARINKKISK